MGFLLLLGGARSGKSERAVRIAVESGMPVTFIATATAGDREMAARITRHRSDRPPDWSTAEAPVELAAAIASAPSDRFLVVDCLTLWVSNLLGAGVSPDAISRRSDECASSLASRNGVVVSNEVGLGIVPANDLAREYRDVLGAVNAAFARCAERSLFMVAGKMLELT